MEKELNIAAILKYKPQYTGLWSPMLGNCKYIYITEENNIRFNSNCNKCDYFLDKNGKVTKDGELMVYPSRNMRSWEKFAWKKGDVLILDGEEGIVYCIFEAFEDDEYTLFKSRFACSDESRNIWLPFNTKSFTKHYKRASDDEANEFIKKVEEHYGGKLNLSTLEIGQPKPEFKNGDIVYIGNAFNEYIGIFKEMINDNQIKMYADCHKNEKKARIGYWLSKNDSDVLRLATDSEKQQLFAALAKEGKVWDAEKKAIVDLPKKCEFEPFQKVMIRSYEENEWRADFFSYYDEKSNLFPYVCVGSIGSVCIPYNDSTKHLLGTTDEWKGGEG